MKSSFRYLFNYDCIVVCMNVAPYKLCSHCHLRSCCFLCQTVTAITTVSIPACIVGLPLFQREDVESYLLHIKSLLM